MQKVFIVSGEKAGGKTTFTANLTNILKQQNKIRLCGFLSRGYWENNRRSHYVLESLTGESSMLICSARERKNSIKAGPWFFEQQAISQAYEMIRSHIKKCDLLVIDEVGKLELNNNIWDQMIKEVLLCNSCSLLLVVRDLYVEGIIHKYKLNAPDIFNIQQTTAVQAAGLITDLIQKP